MLRLSHEEFVKRAIERLRGERYRGIHTVFSGFNEAFKRYFEGEDPVEEIKRLVEEGKVVIRPAKRGVMIYLPGEVPEAKNYGDRILEKMGIGEI